MHVDYPSTVHTEMPSTYPDTTISLAVFFELYCIKKSVGEDSLYPSGMPLCLLSLPRGQTVQLNIVSCAKVINHLSGLLYSGQ